MKMKKYLSAVMLASVLIMPSCADRSAGDTMKIEEHEPYYNFTDDMGNTVVLDEKPKKVAVLFSSYAQVWALAGGSVDISVGESVERGFADVSCILVDSGAGKSVNSELLIASEPDFVICSADIAAQSDAAKLLRDAGIPAALFKVETFEDYLDMLDICTDITGDKEAFGKNGTEVAERIDSLLSSLDGGTETEDILFIRAGSSASSTKAKKAKDHFAAAMLEELGAYNIADNAPILLDGLSIEEIIASDPDHIFISIMGNEEAARENMNAVMSSAAWQSLSAVRNGNYTYLPKELFQFKPNDRWDEAYEYLIGILYE